MLLQHNALLQQLLLQRTRLVVRALREEEDLRSHAKSPFPNNRTHVLRKSNNNAVALVALIQFVMPARIL